MAEKHHPGAGFDSFTGEKGGGARGEFSQVGIGVLLFASITLDAHGHARRMTFGRGLE